VLVDEWHRVAQERLQTATGAAAEQALLRITLDRAPYVMGAYASGVSRLLGGGQLAAGQLALAYMAAYMPPRHPPDLTRALAPVAVTPASPQSTAGLARLWRLLDEDVPEGEARESAGFYASGVAVGNLQQAERLGMDEGADAAELEGPVRYRLHPNPGACHWCLFIADTGARYLTAASVPVPHSPSNPKQKGGVCRCSPAVGEEGEVLMREMEGAGAGLGGEGEGEPTPPEGETAVDRITINGGTPAQQAQVRETLALTFENIPDELAERIPSVNVQTSGLNGAAADYLPSTNRIRILDGMFDDYGVRARNNSVESGWWTPDGLVEPAQQTLTHEMGHFLDYQMTSADRLELRSVLRSKYGISQSSAGTVPTTGRGATLEVVDPGGPNSHLPNGNLRPRVSTYAGKSTQMKETVAELWAEYKTAPQPRDQARFLGSYIEAALGKGSAQNLGEAWI
jgi:hypothetical protein